MIGNGKYGGSGAILNSYALINDGLLDFFVCSKKHGFGGMVQFMDQVIKFQGIHAYREDMDFFRAKTLRVEQKNPLKPGQNERPISRYAIDGEDLSWRNFVKFETLYNELEVLVDFDYMMSQQKHFATNK